MASICRARFAGRSSPTASPSRCDQDFRGVIAACADRAETWINADIERAMLALHALGHAHSVEVWNGEALVGGLYGVKLGRAFFGESMFSRETDASKVALAWLVARLRVGGYTLLDCQFITDHLASLGAVSMPRDDYVSSLSAALGGEEGTERLGPGEFSRARRIRSSTVARRRAPAYAGREGHRAASWARRRRPGARRR